MNKAPWIVALILSILVGGCQEAVPPATAPAALAAQLELRLAANQDSYALDRGGQAAEETRPQLPGKNAEESRPAIPQVDLTLELHNRSGGPVIIPGGTRDWYTLKLDGPGAVETFIPAMWCIPSPDITVDPGKSHSVALRQISYFRGKRATIGCWTRPGDYALTAAAQVKVQGQEVTVRSKPLRLKVVDGPRQLPAGNQDGKKEAKWEKLFEDEAWYKNTAGKEQVFRGKLEAIPNAGGPSTLQRTSYYKLGDRTIYTGAKKVQALERLVGKQVEIRGKPVDMELEGQSLKEIWPAAVRPQP